jgi:hypothetical protein
MAYEYFLRQAHLHLSKQWVRIFQALVPLSEVGEKKRLKMDFVVTIFRFFIVGNYTYATSACWSVTES